MSDGIEIRDEGDTLESTEVLIQEPTVGGYMGFSSVDGKYWTQLGPHLSVGSYDSRRYPYPLFQSKDELLEVAKRFLPNGGKVKFWRIKL